MFYSGDTDGAVPTYGSKRWIKELNFKRIAKWAPWTTDGQVSGFIERYEGFDFITVKGVGHMAPQQNRKAVTSMITAHMHGDPIGPFDTSKKIDIVQNPIFGTAVDFLRDVEDFIIQ